VLASLWSRRLIPNPKPGRGWVAVVASRSEPHDAFYPHVVAVLALRISALQ
jgi:hypothetical protein